MDFFYLGLLFTSIKWLSAAGVITGRHNLYNCRWGQLSRSYCALWLNFPPGLSWGRHTEVNSNTNSPKCMSNQEVCSLTWTDFINRRVEVNQFCIDLSPIDQSATSGDAALSIRAGCPSLTLLNESDFNDITLERITIALASFLALISSRSVFMPQVPGLGLEGEKCSQQEVKIHTHLLRSHHTHQCKTSYNPANVRAPVNSSSHWDKSDLIRNWKCEHTWSVWWRESLGEKRDEWREHRNTHIIEFAWVGRLFVIFIISRIPFESTNALFISPLPFLPNGILPLKD